MQKDINISGLGRTSLEIPNSCIHCHENVGFIISSKTEPIDHGEYSAFALTFLCPSCYKFSVFEYNNLPRGYSYYDLVAYSYQKKVNVYLPSNIEKVSEKFVEIFEQAATAETYNLMSICGVAYRKAAEFLIKDYVISKHPDQEDNIKTDPLGKIINEQLDDFPKVQTLARATAWLGNDETHYVRKHNDKDLSDLKAFLLAAATFIAADYDADQALALVSK